MMNYSKSNNEIEDIKPKHFKVNILVIVIAIICIVCVILSFYVIYDMSTRCGEFKCNNRKLSEENYCAEHKCPVDGCKLPKRETYCSAHEKELTCSTTFCYSLKVENGKYCSWHTCEKAGCTKAKLDGSNYCLDHQVDMKKRLTDVAYGFSLDSAGGIKFVFKGYNATGKNIKYIRFDLYLENSVGDSVYDEITRKSYIPVEIIGEFPAYEKFTYSKTIGYADSCSKISTKEITIIYMDGTSETGSFGYYFSR